MKHTSILLVALLALSSFAARNERKDSVMTATKAPMLALIDRYAKSVNEANADSLESLFWSDDPNFTEVENDRALPFGKSEFLAIADWIRKNAKPGLYQVFDKTDVYLLSPDVAYSVSLRKDVSEGTTTRVTFIFLKKKDEWRIIHGHFSYSPKQ